MVAEAYPGVNLRHIVALGASKEEEEEESTEEGEIIEEPVTEGDGTDEDVIEETMPDATNHSRDSRGNSGFTRDSSRIDCTN